MYDVTLENHIVGNVVLQRQGAYYLVRCCCNAHMTQRYHLILIINDHETDLGVCVPSKTGLELITRIKVSEIGDTIPRFVLVNHNTQDNGSAFAVNPSEPFAAISQIQYGRLNIERGMYQIIFPVTDQCSAPVPQGSDRNPEHPHI